MMDSEDIPRSWTFRLAMAILAYVALLYFGFKKLLQLRRVNLQFNITFKLRSLTLHSLLALAGLAAAGIGYLYATAPGVVANLLGGSLLVLGLQTSLWALGARPALIGPPLSHSPRQPVFARRLGMKYKRKRSFRSPHSIRLRILPALVRSARSQDIEDIPLRFDVEDINVEDLFSIAKMFQKDTEILRLVATAAEVVIHQNTQSARTTARRDRSSGELADLLLALDAQLLQRVATQLSSMAAPPRQNS